jgi:2,3-bisphosphoglycerate-independent phosphoglycerate mutase
MKLKTLLNRTADVTRSMVQKAVVVLASQPILGSVRSKLGLVTQAYFAQKDFSQLDILKSLYDNLQISTGHISIDNALYMGTCLRELIHKFKSKVLILLKALILERRVFIFGY